MFILLACVISFFFAANIGASGAAASMGIAYGSGVVKSKKNALLFCAIGIFLGATIGGGNVAKTISSGIVPENTISIYIALIILASAAISLFFANLSGIPLSTSEVTVGAIVGVGIAYQALFIKTLAVIIMFWILVPLIAFLLAYAANSVIKIIRQKYPFLSKEKSTKVLAILVILTGFFEAFSSGMNNVANAVGPIIAAGIINIHEGMLFGGMVVALGAYFLGANVIETNGKRITDLSLLQGTAVSGIGGILVIIASIFGIPIPHTQVTTCSILGIGASDKGKELWKKAIVVKLIKTWVISPVFSLVISYNLVKIFIYFDFSGIAVLFLFIVFVYVISQWKPSKNQPVRAKKIVTKNTGGNYCE
ncbi:inorganic phosphate transporter [Oceanobacillus salinisoli]|uniref:inorganic phosphate transporter n=1 Tax=Oceanobacillus salinisoli TaxID=2678611 RepID=UPI0012E1ADE8|nr:inorganic phosphate transporter [Oceanobacillus salinisoli]